MPKDSGGRGSERRATAEIYHDRQYHDIHIGPSKAAVAKGRGWDKAVSFHAPGRVATVHENMAKAKARLQAHPGFVKWK